MLKRFFNRKYREIIEVNLEQYIPFEEKPYVKSELNRFLNSSREETTNIYKYFIY